MSTLRLALLVVGEDVVVRDDDDLLRVPHLRVLRRTPLEDAERARAAHVVRHQYVDVIQMLSPGRTEAASVWLARIFSVSVMGRVTWW